LFAAAKNSSVTTRVAPCATDDGHPIGPIAVGAVVSDDRGPLLSRDAHPDIGPGTAAALWGGAEMEFNYAVSVIADACEFAEARAAPDR